MDFGRTVEVEEVASRCYVYTSLLSYLSFSHLAAAPKRIQNLELFDCLFAVKSASLQELFNIKLQTRAGIIQLETLQHTRMQNPNLTNLDIPRSRSSFRSGTRKSR